MRSQQTKASETQASDSKKRKRWRAIDIGGYGDGGDWEGMDIGETKKGKTPDVSM